MLEISGALPAAQQSNLLNNASLIRTGPYIPEASIPILRSRALWNPPVAGQAFTCGSTADGLGSADSPIIGVDFVSFDGCSSALYRWSFCMPDGFTSPSILVTGNYDDACVAYLNGNRLQQSGALVGDQFPQPPGVLQFPDLTSTTETMFFQAGENDLVFAVHGDLSTDPTSFQFTATVFYDYQGLTQVGSGCAGSLGVPTIRGTSQPLIGNPFGLELDQAAACRPAALLIFCSPNTTMLPGPGGCSLEIGGQVINAFGGTTTAQGRLSINFGTGIPVDIGLVGPPALELYGQFLVADPAGGILIGGVGLSASPTLRVRVGC